jgi:hypothetical protein
MDSVVFLAHLDISKALMIKEFVSDQIVPEKDRLHLLLMEPTVEDVKLAQPHTSFQIPPELNASQEL